MLEKFDPDVELSLPNTPNSPVFPLKRDQPHRNGRRSRWAVTALTLFLLSVIYLSLRGCIHTMQRMQNDMLGISNSDITLVKEVLVEKPVAKVAAALDLSQRTNISPGLLSTLTRSAIFSDIAYCVSPPGPGLKEPFKCIGRCDLLGDVQLVRSWSGLGLQGEGRGATGGYVALEIKPSTEADDVHEASLRIVFRGTYSIIDALSDLALQPQPYAPYNGTAEDYGSVLTDIAETDCADPAHNCSAHAGFLASWHASRPAVLNAISSLLAQSSPTERGPLIRLDGRPEPVLLTDVQIVGHSLGGAVACLAGLDMVRGRFLSRHAADTEDVEDQFSLQLPVTVTTFGEPRVGNVPFAKYVDRLFSTDVEAPVPRDPLYTSSSFLDKYYRVTHQGDPVPLLPPRLGNARHDRSKSTPDEDDPTSLYSSHSHEIFIVPDSGVNVKPEDVIVCKGRSDQMCSIGKDGRNEAFWGAEGWFWKWVGRRIAGQSDDGVIDADRISKIIGELRKLGGDDGDVEIADAEMLHHRSDDDVASPFSFWRFIRPKSRRGDIEVTPVSEDERSSIFDFWKTRRPFSSRRSEVVSTADTTAVAESSLPTLPAPIWKQIRSHREYFILLGLCVPPGWGW